VIQQARVFIQRVNLVGFCISLLACAKSPAKNPNDENGESAFVGQTRDNEMKHEPCEGTGRTVKKFEASNAWSTNHAYVVYVYQGERKICSFSDLNGDDRIDLYTYFDEQGRVWRREASYRLRQPMDEISLYKNGEIDVLMRDTTSDEKIDTWDFYKNGQLVRRERDKNGDGHIDEWWQFNAASSTATITPADPLTGKPNLSQRVQVSVEMAKPTSVSSTQPASASSFANPASQGAAR